MTRTDWTREEMATQFDLPFDELVYQAATVQRAHHTVGQMQHCTLLSMNTYDKPLTAANAGDDKVGAMLAKLGLVPMEAEEPLRACKALEAAE